MSWVWWLVSIISFFLLVSGSILAYTQHRLLCRAVFVQGTVIDLIEKQGAKTGITFTPRIRYKTPDGKTHTFDGSFSSSPPPYPLGATVPVAHDPTTSAGAIATFGACYGFATVLLCFGLFGAMLTTAFVFGPRWVPAAYMARAIASEVSAASWRTTNSI